MTELLGEESFGRDSGNTLTSLLWCHVRVGFNKSLE